MPVTRTFDTESEMLQVAAQNLEDSAYSLAGHVDHQIVADLILLSALTYRIDKSISVVGLPEEACYHYQ